MAKEKYYGVNASKIQNDGISFHKLEDGLIEAHMGYSEVVFTVKECRDIIDKLKQCIKS